MSVIDDTAVDQENTPTPAEQTEVQTQSEVQVPTGTTDVPAEPAPTPAPADAEDTIPDDEEVPEDTTVYRANAKEDFPARTESKSTVALDIANTISLLYTSVRGADASVAALRDRVVKDPANAAQWMAALRASDNFTPIDNPDAGYAAWREGATWRQFVEHEGKRLRGGVPGISGGSSGHMLSGEAALRAVQTRLSMGQHLQRPMWNSGFWVTMTPPMDKDILALERRIQMEKISLGRETRGVVFDNYQVYIVEHLLRFAYAHISETSMKYGAEGLAAALNEHLLVSDIPNLLLTLLRSMYPNGYDLVQPCTVDIATCNHVAQGLIDFGKLDWVDTSMLNDAQRRHMSRRKGESHTQAEVKTYQAGFATFNDNVIELDGAIRISLSVPTVGKYIDSGRRWVDAIDKDSIDVFGTDLVGQDRERYMYDQAVLTTLQAYSHWFGEIILLGTDGGDDQVITDQTTLEQTAGTLSRNPEIVKDIERGVRRFSDSSTCTVFGLVNYECPKCKRMQLRPDAPGQVIIPMDIVGTFFTLLSNRLRRILSQ